MAYNEYDVTKPDPTTQAITAYSQSIRNNDAAVRDAVVTGAFLNWNYLVPNNTAASFTGSVTSNTLSVSALSSGFITTGMLLKDAGTTIATVTGQLSVPQFGGTGATFSLTTTSNIGSRALTCEQPDLALPVCYVYSKSTTEKLLSVNVYDGNSNCTSAEYWYWASSTWTRIGKETFTYDGSQNVTASTWS